MEEQWLGMLSEIFGSTTEASDGKMEKKTQFACFAKYHWAPQMADNDTGVTKGKS